ncbi:MAG: hypothetical protein ACK481_05995 [Candidatus Melainabacteria bacterium]|jgi:uncharacterized iron-regulated membrane protein
MQKFLRRTHGALGLLFGVFILIQGVTAVLLGFDDQIEKLYGENTVKTIENIHKGKIYGPYKSPYRVLVGLSLVYMSISGIWIGFSTISASKKKTH